MQDWFFIVVEANEVVVVFCVDDGVSIAVVRECASLCFVDIVDAILVTIGGVDTREVFFSPILNSVVVLIGVGVVGVGEVAETVVVTVGVEFATGCFGGVFNSVLI